jgi:hypothetical protein
VALLGLARLARQCPAPGVIRTATAILLLLLYVGRPDGTAQHGRRPQIRGQPEEFAVSGDSVNWTGPSGDCGLRRMILHYAHLCAVAGGVDAFLIGTEMRGLTTIRLLSPGRSRGPFGTTGSPPP